MKKNEEEEENNEIRKRSITFKIEIKLKIMFFLNCHNCCTQNTHIIIRFHWYLNLKQI